MHADHPHDNAGRPLLLDEIASNIRTALDDPAGVGLDAYDWELIHDGRAREAIRYAIRQADAIIAALNPSEDRRDLIADGFEVLQRQTEERASTCYQVDADEADQAAYWRAGQHALHAERHLRLAAEYLRGTRDAATGQKRSTRATA